MIAEESLIVALSQRFAEAVAEGRLDEAETWAAAVFKRNESEEDAP